MIAELGSFSVDGLGTDFYHGGITFQVLGLDADLSAWRFTFKVTGLDAILTVGGTVTPDEPPVIIPTRVTIVGGEPVMGGQSLVTKDEEEEIMLIVKLYMEHYYEQWL